MALPDLHEVYLPGKTVMIGCPKFDDPEPYIQKFADIFRINSIKEITAVVMEVPCCQGLPALIKKGMEMAGKDIPLQKIVINTRGDVIQKEQLCPESPLGKRETSKPLKP